MTDDAKPPETGMERIAALEHTVGVQDARLKILEKAMHAAFGKSWMEQVIDEVARDGQ